MGNAKAPASETVLAWFPVGKQVLTVAVLVIVGVDVVADAVERVDDLLQQKQAVQRAADVVGRLGQIVARADRIEATLLIVTQ